ncbi:MFS transporter [Bacillus arachidis]|uniref:MFS transporter n=1 Tax=Bacillus arachidis TaxID=2819290 RepID=A0ABS3P5U8_9BACI|nr:MFS transporter [Bacillus arachidis]MBO1628552.1 MFS transporter [Bacillus arachidis]
MINTRIPVPIKILLTAVLFMNTGSFMIMPFLALHLTNDLHFSSWEVGTILTTILIAHRGLPVFTGFIGDRVSHTVNVIGGVMVRALGFGAFIFADSFWSVTIAAFFFGFGGALFDPSVTAFFTSQKETVQKKIFTYFNQMLNTGVIIGPLVGAILVKFNPVYPFTIAGIGMLVLSFILFTYRSKYPRTIKDNQKVLLSLKTAISNKLFISFICVLSLFWIMFAQLNISFPIKAYDLSGNTQLVSSLFIINGVSGLLLMFFLRKVFINQDPMIMVKIGVLIMGIAIGMIPLIPSIYWMLFCVFLYTLGETLALPGAEMTVAQFSANKPAGLFFGMFQACWAIGGSLGNYLGAWLNKFNHISWCWLIFLGIGVLASILFTMIHRSMKGKTEFAEKQNIGSLT